MADLKQILLDFIKLAYQAFANLFELPNIICGSDANWFGEFNWDNIIQAANTISKNTIYPIGVTIIGICIMIDLIQVASKFENVKWETLVMVCAKAAIAKVCLDVMPTFLEACYKQSTALMKNLATQTFGLSSTKVDISNSQKLVEEALKGQTGMWAILGVFLVAFILVVIILLSVVIVNIVVLARMYELIANIMVAPLPCAFAIAGSGSGGIEISRTTSNFLKNFAAICIQGVIMIIVINLCAAMGAAIMSPSASTGKMFDFIIPSVGEAADGGPLSIMKTLVGMMLCSLTLVVTMLKSNSWAKSMVGAS